MDLVCACVLSTTHGDTGGVGGGGAVAVVTVTGLGDSCGMGVVDCSRRRGSGSIHVGWPRRRRRRLYQWSLDLAPVEVPELTYGCVAISNGSISSAQMFQLPSTQGDSDLVWVAVLLLEHSEPTECS